MAWVATRNGNVGAIAPAADDQRRGDGHRRDHAAAPGAVGEGGDGEDEDDPGAHDRAGDAHAACRSTPKSSAAKLTVWVNSVLTNADDIDAAASSPSTSSVRGSSRSGGAHHGVRVVYSSCGCVGAVPRRAIDQRTGSANTHANHGIE